MKRFFYIVGVFLVSLLLVLTMLTAVLMSDRVQTAAVQWVTSEFAEALGTNAHIGAVHYHFPARVSVHDIYLEDRNQDTLLYVDEIYLHLRVLPLLRGNVQISHAHIRKARSKLYESDGEWNYQFLLDAFQSEKTDDNNSGSSTLISVRDIALDSISVQYGDYAILLPHASMDLHELTGTSLNARVNQLALQVFNTADTSATPLILKDLNAHIVRNDTVFTLPSFRAQLSQSQVDMSGVELRFSTLDSLTMEQLAHQTTYSLDFRQVDIVPSDLSLLVPQLKGVRYPLSLNGALSGRLDSLHFDGIAVKYNNRPVLSGDVVVTGLPETENVFVRAKVENLQTNAARLQDFISQLQNKPYQLPQPVHNLGNISYKGQLEGKLSNLTLDGGFTTAKGNIYTSGKLVATDDSTTYSLSLRTKKNRNFRLGEMLGDRNIGDIAFNFTTTGRIFDGAGYGRIDAEISQFSYNGYTFEALHLNGNYEPLLFEGSFDINDPHMDLAFSGKINVKEENPVIDFDFACNHFDLYPFTEDHDPTVWTSFNMHVDLDGINRDQINGYVNVDSLSLATRRGAVLYPQVLAEVKAGLDNTKEIKINAGTDFDASIEGTYTYVDLIPSMQDMLCRFLPSAIPANKQRWAPVDFNVVINGNKIEQLQRLFKAPVTVSDDSHIKIAYAYSSTLNLDFMLNIPRLQVNSMDFEALHLHLANAHPKKELDSLFLSLSTVSERTNLAFSTVAFRDSMLSDFHFHRVTHDMDSLIAELDYLSDDERTKEQMAIQREGDYHGNLRFTTFFSKYNQQPLIEMHFMRDTFLVRNAEYHLDESRIAYSAAESWLYVNGFALEGPGQHIRAHGMASNQPDDTLSISLERMDVGYVVPFVLPKEAVSFAGRVTGTADVVSIFGNPKIESVLHVDSFQLNDCYLGDADATLSLKEDLIFHADVREERGTHYSMDSLSQQVSIVPDSVLAVALDGKVDMTSGHWRLDMQVDSVPLAFVNHWTSSVLEDLNGRASGTVVVGDKGRSTYVLLRAKAQDASLRLPWTGVTYLIPSDSILMDSTSIRFPNVHLTDTCGNHLALDGAIYHDYFRGFTLDLHADIKDALVLDLNEPGDMQGTVFATGNVDITGPDNDILVQADAVTSRNSHFRYSIDNISSAYESNFIHFVDPSKRDSVSAQVADSLYLIRAKNRYARTSRCLIKMNIETNPMLLFSLVLGERSGDMIQARGNGALSLRYDTQTGEVTLLGTYDIESGSLNYTVANMIRKDFIIGAGSSIIFPGNPSNPQLDVMAKYRVTASLRDLFGEDMSSVATTRTNIPVLTCLNMKGGLNNPVLNFSLEFPNTDQMVQQQIKQVINTDEMLMRQVVYLLVFGQFFTPENMTNMQGATLNSTYSLLSSTVTGQINAWLSKLTNMLTLGVAIRTDGEGSDRSQEYEANFQLQPVDRLVINGNFGYRYNDISNQPFFGDLDVEVLLTEDGQWRLKGYTHTVDKYSLRQASTIQGVGIMWKKDF